MQRTRAVALVSRSLRLRQPAQTNRRGLAYKAPVNEINFLLDKVYDIENHYATKLPNTGGENAPKEMVDMVITEMAKFSENILAPCNETADNEGCVHSGPNDVKTPTGFKDAYDAFVAGGWQGLSYPEKYGGQGLPYSLSLLGTDMAATANWTWLMYPGLSKGCINTILDHGTDVLKDKYVPPLVSGEWTGTMCLTEPQCGSDLAQVATKAIPNGDGSYSLSGTKIFISCGEHDMVDNIIHCVLARLPDAPAGTKGISLFLVPKVKVNDDMTLGDMNGVTVDRIEHKMGCHGSSTCQLNFENAQGYLLGTENRGLNHMFTFINTSRLGTAIQGVAATEGSFQNALWYAKERLAMRSLSGTKNKDGPADPIITHPDVRRMLLTQKCFAEAGRSMVFECALLTDLQMEAAAAGDKKTEAMYEDRLGFLTPILKGFLTESGVEAANLGIQVYGGHGYIKANKQEQIARDVRIAPVWEGTTGIQALDLLGRKILLGKLKPITGHVKREVSAVMDILKAGKVSRGHAFQTLKHLAEWQFLAMRVAGNAAKDKETIGVASVDFLMYSGYVHMAVHWLKMEHAAAVALEGANSNPDFYKAKQQTANFYFEHLLPRTRRHVATMFTPSSVFMDMPANHFSFDHAL